MTMQSMPLLRLFLALPTLFPAALFLLPLFWRRQQMFTIAVEPDFLRSPQASMLRRVYFVVVVALGLGGFAASVLAVNQSASSPAWLLMVAPLLEVAGLSAVWAWAWR